jgi:aldehyde:ferredoxin oxidoreductase
MHGFYGRILLVNLTDRTYRIEPVADEVLAAGLGGKGLATRLLLERNPVGVDPFAEENHLIFATGPLCQSRIWGGSRYGVFTKSPQTLLYSESYAGGKVPEAVDAAGYDAVLFYGKARRPTVASVHPDGVEFFDAGDLWGADTFKTEAEVKKRFAIQKDGYRKPGAVVIGPAGEKLLRFAVIENDKWRSAGRTGVGAVMGSKLLKAVVFQGDVRRGLYDPDAVARYAREFSKANIDHPGVKAYKALGTTMMVAIMNKAQAFPTRYWAEGTFEHWEKISGQTMHQEHDVKPNACAKCLMACGRLTTIKKGRHTGLVIEGPEYETIYAFGGLCMIEEIEEIAYLNDICDRVGMDTITAGNLCAFTIEAARRGKVDYDIDYNQPEKIAKLLKEIGNREGIGDVLAEGIVHAAKTWGLEDLAIHVKGMEPAGYDPRTLKGMGLSYATSDRGACHLRTTFYKPELAGMIPPATIEGKAELLTDFEDRLTIFDTLILCRFYRDLYTWEELEKVIGMVTGLPASKEELRKKASAISTMTRQFNLREGLRPEQDRLPKRLHREALPTGQALSEEEMEQMLKEYFCLRGWDEQGIPPAA